MRDLMRKGLMALTVEDERQEVRAVLNSRQPLKLRFHKGSENMGKIYNIDCRLWDVLTPISGYPPSGGVAGWPTLSLQGMKDRGLI